MRILGIDPGYGLTGFGLIESDRGQNRLLRCGITGRTVIGVLGIICVLVGTLQMNFFYHCPHCKRDLPKRTLPKTCPYCKKPLD